MTEGLEARHRQAAELRATADRLMRRYDRTSWIRYLVYFSAAPMFVVVFRLQMEFWGYAFAGALYLALGLAMSLLDSAAVKRRNAAVAAAEHAETELARASSPASIAGG